MATLPHKIGPHGPDTAPSTPFASPPLTCTGPTHSLLDPPKLLQASTFDDIPTPTQVESNAIASPVQTHVGNPPPVNVPRLLLLLTMLMSYFAFTTSFSIDQHTQFEHTQERPTKFTIRIAKKPPWHHFEKQRPLNIPGSNLHSDNHDMTQMSTQLDRIAPQRRHANRDLSIQLARARARHNRYPDVTHMQTAVPHILSKFEQSEHPLFSLLPSIQHNVLCLLQQSPNDPSGTRVTQTDDIQHTHNKPEIRKAAPLSVKQNSTLPTTVFSSPYYTSLQLQCHVQPFRTIELDTPLRFVRDPTRSYEPTNHQIFDHHATPCNRFLVFSHSPNLTIYIVPQVSSPCLRLSPYKTPHIITMTPATPTAIATAASNSRAFFPEVLDIQVVFGNHHNDSQFSVLFNNAYSIVIPFADFLLADGSNWTNAGNIVKEIRAAVVTELTASATRTADKTLIAPLLQTAILQYANSKTTYKKLRSANELDNGLKHLLRKNNNADDDSLTFVITLQTNQWFVDSSKPLDPLDLSILANTAFATRPPAAPPVAATGPATTAALDPNVIAMLQQMDKNARTFANTLKPTTTSSPSTHPFVPNNFPLEVQERVKACNLDYQYPMANELTLFNVTNNNTAKYYVDPNHIGTSFVALSGHYFIIEDRGANSDKNFKTGVNKCSGYSAFELYNWYTTFTEHCLRFGKYCHPYCCYSNHCASPRGFSVGPGNDDDVSSTFATLIDNASRLIWDTLKIAFSDLPSLLATVDVNNGKGYHALNAIMCDQHPLLIHDPITLCSNRPVQGDMSLQAYWNKYNHFVMVRALVENIPSNLSHPNEIKHFIHGCKYSIYIEGEVRREQYLPALAYKFTPQNIVNTLQGYLHLSNSPAKAAATARPRTSTYGTTRRRLYSNDYKRPTLRNTSSSEINHIEYSEHEHATPSETFVHDDEPTDDTIDMAYSMAIHQIKKNPASAIQPCLVCEVVYGTPPKDNHRFEDCKVLKDHPLLQKNFINICSTLKRTRKALEARSVKEITTQPPLPDTISDDRCTVINQDDTQLPDFHQGGF